MIIKCSCCGGDKVTKGKKNHYFEYKDRNMVVHSLKCFMEVYSCPDCDFQYYGAEGERAMVDAVRKFDKGLK